VFGSEGKFFISSYKKHLLKFQNVCLNKCINSNTPSSTRNQTQTLICSCLA